MPPRDNTKTLFIIRWVKYGKPYYQMGEMFQNQDKLYPGPSEIYHSLQLILKVFKWKYEACKLNIITMGMTADELHVIDQFRISGHQVLATRNIPKPIGKKDDGTLYRVFLADPNYARIKEIMQIMAPEHFEIVGIAKNGSNAYDFVSGRAQAIDIVIAALDLEDCTAYQLIEELKRINPALQTVVTVKEKKLIDQTTAARILVNFHIVSPVDKTELLDKLRTLLS